MSYETADIRQFLTDAFNDEELEFFCFDYFPDVHNNFASGMTKGRKIQLLIEHCQRRNLFILLRAAVERARPDGFKKEVPPRVSLETLPKHLSLRHDPQQIFVSHAHQDSYIAQALADDLKHRGWRVWIAPNSIQPGEKWVEAIDRGLKESGVFVLVLTEAAIISTWVKDETNVAIDLEHRGHMRFIPLELEDLGERDVPLLWSMYQWVSFRGPYEDGLTALLLKLEQSNVDSH